MHTFLWHGVNNLSQFFFAIWWKSNVVFPWHSKTNYFWIKRFWSSLKKFMLKYIEQELKREIIQKIQIISVFLWFTTAPLILFGIKIMSTMELLGERNRSTYSMFFYWLNNYFFLAMWSKIWYPIFINKMLFHETMEVILSLPLFQSDVNFEISLLRFKTMKLITFSSWVLEASKLS